ncbi:integrase and RNaseH domain-containing protein [Golovinomyces cichoracearum]|uniref:Integrase and RNaseH domain-containing protein n=1 Tax=Golovinomyces cichoracearum TaxID=62708 RepID=A0A420ISC7_9PEZI|nr:integrase and RNaseH domain-containing protein [Golovinomyces cichoracearum]
MISPPTTTYSIDEGAWGKSFDPTQKDQCKEPIINGYITLMILKYEMSKYTDILLWKDFREDFERWSIDIFKISNRTALKKLRDHLVTHGVWIKAQAVSISYAKVLQECLDSDIRYDWTEQEINDHLIEYRGLFDSRSNPTNYSATPAIKQSSITPKKEFPESLSAESNFSSKQQFPSQITIPGRSSNFEGVSTKLLTDLMKIYSQDDKKYGGEFFDFLDVKLQEFYDCCAKIGLTGAYHHAFSIMLKGRARSYYYSMIARKSYYLTTMVNLMRTHFETDENRQMYISEWRMTTLKKTIIQNPDKSRLKCLKMTIETLQKLQQGLPIESRGENVLRDQLINACRGVEECNLSLYKPAIKFKGVCAELRSAVGTFIRSQDSSAFNNHTQFNQQTNLENYDESQFWTDRTYQGRNRENGYKYSQHGETLNGNKFRAGAPRGNFLGSRNFQERSRQKKCYKAYERFQQHTQYTTDREVTPHYYQSFLAHFEGLERIPDHLDNKQEIDQLLMKMQIEDEKCHDGFFTEFGEINGAHMVAILNDQSTLHAVTTKDLFKEPFKPEKDTSTFTFESRYSSEIFQGIMPDSGAAGVSTAGEPQFIALQKIDPTVQLDTSTAG